MMNRQYPIKLTSRLEKILWKGDRSMPLKETDTRFWKRVKELARTNMKQPTYDVFIAPAELISVTGNQAQVLVDSDFHKDYWRRQSDLLNTASLETYGDILTYNFTSTKEIPEKDLASINQENLKISENLETTTYSFPSNVLKKYTFDNFVEGKSNQMALAAAISVIDKPGDMYNPFFIFGNSGLGKTHLLHAVGNEFIKHYPRKHVLYASSESFVTDYVNYSRKKQMDIFTNKYRDVDLLLIDDIQFFADKEGTKNEFFSVFEYLYNKGAQIFLTADRPPNELDNLEDRLVTRFQWGLTTNITSPDFETRMAILMNKAEEKKLDFPEDTIAYVAGQISSNVRELEGALNQIELQARVNKVSTVDIKTAEIALATVKSHKNQGRRTNLTITKIKEEAAKYFHLPVADITGPKRMKEIAYARQIAMYLIRDLLGTSLPTIGNEFGNRDHTTVMYAVRVITEKMKNDSDTQRDIDNLKRKLE